MIKLKNAHHASEFLFVCPMCSTLFNLSLYMFTLTPDKALYVQSSFEVINHEGKPGAKLMSIQGILPFLSANQID